mgnify:CR=1 FL=1
MRTLSRRLRIQPGQASYSCSLPEGLPVVLFTGCVSLLPGTLAADLEGRRLKVHVLDDRTAARKELERLERRIGKIFPAAAAAQAAGELMA